jgi:hypothetical protein
MPRPSEPTRARIVVKQQGGDVVVQNALGFKVARIVVNVNGKYFTGGPIRDGGEETLAAGNTLEWAGSITGTRFSADVTQTVASRALDKGSFLARAEGEGFVPTGGIGSSLNSSEQWIRGEFEE